MSDSKKVAIYIRVSTIEQSDNDFSSLDGQENQCKSWATQKNHKIVEVYKDTKSGKNLTRPGIERMLLDAKAEKFDLIVVSKLDRISRSLSDFLKLLDKLNSCGVDIAVTTQDIDTSTPAGKALQRMMLIFAEFERDMVSERTKEKRIETLKAGRWQGGIPPLGYDVEEGKLVKNEEEADLVREIFQRYINRKSSHEVVRSLNNDGHRTKIWKTKKGNLKGGAKFSKGSILRMLKSRLYLGEYEFESKIYDGIHDPIVDREIYEEVQKIIHQNSTNPKKYVTSNTPAILTDRSYCGFCDYSLTITSTTKSSSGKKYYYYKCVKKNKEGVTTDHSPKDLPVLALDNFVGLTMTIMMKEPELLKTFKKRREFESENIEKSLNEKIKNLQKRKGVAKREITNIISFIAKNGADSAVEDLNKKLKNLKLEEEEITGELELYHEELKRLKSQESITKDSYKRILKQFVQDWEQNKVGERESMIQTLVRKVTSNVKIDNSGTVEVEYIADKKLESEWAEIKNANSEKIKVRTSGMGGSPGWIRTSDRSVNSRLLCH